MTAPRYGPGDTWPRHQKAYWHSVLAEARRAGWTLKYLDAPHAFGEVSCPGGDHVFLVDKTARGGESASVRARRMIDRCTHRRPAADSEARAVQERCERMLDEAGRLIECADEGLARASALRDAWDSVERLDLQLRTATETVAKVLRIESELQLAWEAVFALDDAPATGEIKSVLDGAAESAEQGRSAAASLRLQSLVERARAYTGRIAVLREALKNLQERTAG